MRHWSHWVVANRKLVLILTGIFTAILLTQITNLKIIIDPDNILPTEHPFVQTNQKIEDLFGNKFTIVVTASPKTGDIYQTGFLEKVKSITNSIESTPGVIAGHTNGIATNKVKEMVMTPTGPVAKPILENVPRTQVELDRLKLILHSDPAYEGLLVSKDDKVIQIIAEFSKIPGGFQQIEKNVRSAIAPYVDESIEVRVGGLPIFLAMLEAFSERMVFLFPLALLIIGLIHYEAFRTKQALILPLVTALLAVVWAISGLGLMRQSFDVFNASTPILILAIAAGHAVQILKRYYEEFNRIHTSYPQLSQQQKNHMAVEETLVKVGPVMIVACIVAALGFFSLVIFEIKTIRTFGLFTGFGVLSALLIELTFIPALRAVLPAPGNKEINREKQITIWDRIIEKLFVLVHHHRKQIYIGSGVLLVLFAYGAYNLKIDNSQKMFFNDSLQIKKDDAEINAKLAGTNLVYLLIESDSSILNPNALSNIDKIQTYVNSLEGVGKTLSVVNFVKRAHQISSGNADKYVLPDDPISYLKTLALISAHGESEIQQWVSSSNQFTKVAIFLKTDSSAFIEDFSNKIRSFVNENIDSKLKVSIGGGAVNGAALNEVMIREKILNILQIMFTVFLVSSIVFRSFLAGTLILIPLLAAVVVNFGVMGLLSIPLQIATALVSAMAVGIGADYGIYMTYRLKEELQKNSVEADAIKKAYMSAGKATLFVASAVGGGFGILMLSWGFLIHIWMGFLIACAMIVSALATLTLFSSLILSLRPKFIFNHK